MKKTTDLQVISERITVLKHKNKKLLSKETKKERISLYFKGKNIKSLEVVEILRLIDNYRSQTASVPVILLKWIEEHILVEYKRNRELNKIEEQSGIECRKNYEEYNNYIQIKIYHQHKSKTKEELKQTFELILNRYLNKYLLEN